MSKKATYERPRLIEFGPNLEASAACSTGSTHGSGNCNTGYSGAACTVGGNVGAGNCANGSGNWLVNCVEGGIAILGRCTSGGFR
ncbi:hypothetical protein [Desulfomonile tiedjei]|uniref:hypothetical protein n=1 Tax=Desulfomonile tiedjei TaxID=2358 RepID=UPI0003118985|nr:hypothetical protein [Desulfomonile tiedjei]